MVDYDSPISVMEEMNDLYVIVYVVNEQQHRLEHFMISLSLSGPYRRPPAIATVCRHRSPSSPSPLSFAAAPAGPPTARPPPVGRPLSIIYWPF